MKRTVKSFLARNPALGRAVVRLLLEQHNRLHRWISGLASLMESGIHPKHRITSYHQFFLDNVGLGESVLDIGCGKGELLFDIASSTGGRSVGVEMNPASVLTARERLGGLPNAVVVEGDAWKADCGPEFDIVALSNVLEHLDERPAFLAMLQRRYNPKRFLVRVPMLDRDWLVIYKREHRIEHRLDETHDIEYTQAEFIAEITEAGLTVVSLDIRWGEIYALLECRG